MALHGMVGALIGHSFVSGLSDHFSHCDRNCTPSKIARNLYVSDSVDEIHLVGASGACILRQEVDWEVLQERRDESDRNRDGKTWRIKGSKIIESGQDADVHLVPEVAGGAAAKN